MPWWGSADNSFAFKAMNVNIGARYYFTPWENNGFEVCRGWFLSASFGAGLYDARLNFNGSKGRGLLGNVGGGYSFPLGDWWRMNLSAGIGVMVSDNTIYRATADGNTISRSSGVLTHPDPTSLKVSFTYIFHAPRKK